MNEEKKQPVEKLTQEWLKSLLRYDCETGVFTWLVSMGTRAAGATAGSPNSQNQPLIKINGKKYVAARLAWLYVYGEWPKEMIDHIDGNCGNNAFRNLRDVSNQFNQYNQQGTRANTKTGLMGVTRCAHYKKEKYSACIGVNGKKKHIGVFDTKEEAHAAYVAEKKRIVGEKHQLRGVSP